MKWFLNLRVVHKLAISFGGCLILAMIAGLCALTRMALMDQASGRIYADSVKGDDGLIQITSGVKEYRTWQIRYGSMKNDAGWSQCDMSLSQIAAETSKQIDGYTAHATDPVDLGNVKTLQTYWQSMQSSTPDLARVCKGQSVIAIQRAIEASYAPAKAANDCLSTMAEWNMKHADGLVAAAHDTYLTAQRVTVVILALAIGFGCLLAWLVTRVTIESLTVIQSKLEAIDGGLSELTVNTDALAQGDFILREVSTIDPMKWDRKDEFGALARTYDNMLMKAKKLAQGLREAQKSLTVLVGKVRNAAENIASSSQQLSAGNDDLAQRTSEEASSLEETAASMEEMTSIVKQSADNAHKADELATHAKEVAQNGGEIVTQAVDSMNEINASSKRISDIIAVIDEIAFQTNLLALNAAVEAARVGEQGRGFAVVASEVRNLAGRSSTAAKEIKTLVQDSVRKVEGGSELVNKSGEQLKEIVAAVDKVAEIVDQISGASQEQSAGIEQVNKAVVQLDQITQQNAALVEEASASSQAMAHQASDLSAQVGKFRLDESLITTEAKAPAPVEPRSTAPGKSAQSRSDAPKLKVVGGGNNHDDF